jgi:hypothetical protein
MTGELDRSTAERVIARAMELSGRERRGLSPDQIVAIGGELGIDEVHVRRALAEVLSKPPRVRALDRSVLAARHVELLPAEADRLLGTWFEQVDGMRALRHTGPEFGVWAPRTGMVAGARAAMAKAGGADLDLREAIGVTSTVEPIGDDSALVRLEARVKRDYAITAGIVGAGGAVASVILGYLTWWPLVAGVVAAAAGCYGLLRAQRSESELLALALERRLDAVSASREPALRTPSVTGALGKMREVAERARRSGTRP